METIQGLNEVMARLAFLEDSTSVRLILLYPTAQEVLTAKKVLEQAGLVVAKRFRRVPGLAASGPVALWRKFLPQVAPRPTSVHWDEIVQAVE